MQLQDLIKREAALDLVGERRHIPFKACIRTKATGRWVSDILKDWRTRPSFDDFSFFSAVTVERKAGMKRMKIENESRFEAVEKGCECLTFWFRIGARARRVARIEHLGCPVFGWQIAIEIDACGIPAAVQMDTIDVELWYHHDIEFKRKAVYEMAHQPIGERHTFDFVAVSGGNNQDPGAVSAKAVAKNRKPKS